MNRKKLAVEVEYYLREVFAEEIEEAIYATFEPPSEGKGYKIHIFRYPWLSRPRFALHCRANPYDRWAKRWLLPTVLGGDLRQQHEAGGVSNEDGRYCGTCYKWWLHSIDKELTTWPVPKNWLAKHRQRQRDAADLKRWLRIDKPEDWLDVLRSAEEWWEALKLPPPMR